MAVRIPRHRGTGDKNKAGGGQVAVHPAGAPCESDWLVALEQFRWLRVLKGNKTDLRTILNFLRHYGAVAHRLMDLQELSPKFIAGGVPLSLYVYGPMKDYLDAKSTPPPLSSAATRSILDAIVGELNARSTLREEARTALGIEVGLAWALDPREMEHLSRPADEGGIPSDGATAWIIHWANVHNIGTATLARRLAATGIKPRSNKRCTEYDLAKRWERALYEAKRRERTARQRWRGGGADSPPP